MELDKKVAWTKPTQMKVDLSSIIKEEMQLQIQRQCQKQCQKKPRETMNEAIWRQGREFYEHGYQECLGCELPRFLCQCEDIVYTNIKCMCHKYQRIAVPTKCQYCGNKTICPPGTITCVKACDCTRRCNSCHLSTFMCTCNWFNEHYDDMFDGLQLPYHIDDYDSKKKLLQSDVPTYLLLKQRCFIMPLYDHIRIRTKFDTMFYEMYMYQIAIVINYGNLPNDVIEYILEFVDLPDACCDRKELWHCIGFACDLQALKYGDPYDDYDSDRNYYYDHYGYDDREDYDSDDYSYDSDDYSYDSD